MASSSAGTYSAVKEASGPVIGAVNPILYGVPPGAACPQETVLVATTPMTTRSDQKAERFTFGPPAFVDLV